MSIECYRFNVGTLECIAINDGVETVPVTDLTADARAEQLAQALDERGFSSHELIVNFNCLFIRAGEHRVLVDTGWGRGTQRRDGKLLSGCGRPSHPDGASRMALEV